MSVQFAKGILEPHGNQLMTSSGALVATMATSQEEDNKPVGHFACDKLLRHQAACQLIFVDRARARRQSSCCGGVVDGANNDSTIDWGP